MFWIRNSSVKGGKEYIDPQKIDRWLGYIWAILSQVGKSHVVSIEMDANSCFYNEERIQQWNLAKIFIFGGGGVLVLGDKSFFDIFIEIYRVIEDVYGTFEHIVIDPFLYV